MQIANLKYTLLPFAGALLTLSCQSSKEKVEAKRPNVIYIFPDQFRNCGLSFWGEEGFREHVNFRPDPTLTPNLNAMAKNSFVLSSALSNCPLSSPHRGMLLSGMYPEKNGVTLNCMEERPISSLKEDITCIGDVYSAAGYNCAYFGKLHVDFPTPNNPQNPGTYVNDKHPVWDAYTPPSRRHGFDYWYSYGTFDEHKRPHYWDTNGDRHEIREWSPKHETDEVIAYLENSRGQRDTEKPFFIMLSINPPHSPYASLNDCEEEDYILYKGKSMKELLVRENADTTMKKTANVPYYFASITGVDRHIGRIMKRLKELNLDENTIVVFSSDHGETMCSQGVDDAKNSPYKEAFNVPFIVHYPAKVKPKVDDLLLSTPDIMPTLLGLSGLKDQIPASVQGSDYSDLFLGKEIEKPFGALYIQNVNGNRDENNLVKDIFPIARGIKTDRYTLSLTIDRKTKKLKKVLFFDDVNDPYQMTNLKPENHQDTYKELCNQMGILLKNADDIWYREGILKSLINYN